MGTRVPSLEAYQTCFVSKSSLATGEDERQNTVRFPVAAS